MVQQLNSGVLLMEANIDRPVISAAFPDNGAGKSICCQLIVLLAYLCMARRLMPWDFISPGCWGDVRIYDALEVHGALGLHGALELLSGWCQGACPIRKISMVQRWL